MPTSDGVRLERPCSTCGGTGNVTLDDLTVAECRCAYGRRKAQFLGADIFEAPRLRSTPLVERTQDKLGLVTDTTRENLWITCPWAALRPHLRLALGIKWHVSTTLGRSFHFRILTDEQVRAAALGESTAKVADLLGAEAHLVILRLGFLGWPNKAMPGFLRGALMHRLEIVHEPIWITDTPTEPFSKGHFTWSDETGGFVSTSFKKFALGGEP
jgi:hypothetical protein